MCIHTIKIKNKIDIKNFQRVCDSQWWIYYEANEASASGPHHLGGPHQNFNAVSKADFFIASKILKVNLLYNFAYRRNFKKWTFS